MLFTRADTEKKHRYYSQNGEDFLLWRLFGPRNTGLYVDVGAFDGVHLSNTFSFDQEGWSGICVEPHPFYFQLCKRARPRAVCINVACVAEERVRSVEFYTEKMGLLSGVRGDRADEVDARYTGRGLEFEGFTKIMVPASTLNDILEQHVPKDAEIDFMSIDVEGTEDEVLHGLDLSRFRPRVLVVEANSETARNVLDRHIVEVNGYAEAGRLVENIFYVRDPRDARTLRSITVDCRIEKSIHPLGEKYTPKPYIEGAVIYHQGLGPQLFKRIKKMFAAMSKPWKRNRPAELTE